MMASGGDEEIYANYLIHLKFFRLNYLSGQVTIEILGILLIKTDPIILSVK
jgi:hypothetical protein